MKLRKNNRFIRTNLKRESKAVTKPAARQEPPVMKQEPKVVAEKPVNFQMKAEMMT